MFLRKLTMILVLSVSSTAHAVYNYQNYPWTAAGYDLITYAKTHRKQIIDNATLLYPQYGNYRQKFGGIFEKYQVPSEIMALAAIESSFNAKAVSKAGAAGLWQLMPSTAQSLGLVCNHREDDRFNSRKSTLAAVKYIKWLAETQMGGDYETAVISYNFGIGNTKKAIEKAKSANAWVLISGNYVPKESADHLMKFLSYIEVFEYMDRGRLRLKKIKKKI